MYNKVFINKHFILQKPHTQTAKTPNSSDTLKFMTDFDCIYLKKKTYLLWHTGVGSTFTLSKAAVSSLATSFGVLADAGPRMHWYRFFDDQTILDELSDVLSCNTQQTTISGPRTNNFTWWTYWSLYWRFRWFHLDPATLSSCHIAWQRLPASSAAWGNCKNTIVNLKMHTTQKHCAMLHDNLQLHKMYSKIGPKLVYGFKTHK